MIKKRPHTKKLYIDIQEDLGEVDTHPYGAFLSAELVADGSTLEELRDSAYIYEIDQDGGEYNSYPLSDASNIFIDIAEEIFERELYELLEE